MPTRIDLTGLGRFKKYLSRRPGPIKQALSEWGHIYESFIRRRFVKYSRGGGDWQPLKPATVLAKGNAIILRDTDLLFKSLKPEIKSITGLKPGAKLKATIRVPGNAAYDTGVTVGDVLIWHQYGTSRMPQREVIVSPDSTTKHLMGERLKKGIVQAIGATK